MGMPITVEIVDSKANEKYLNLVYDYFGYIDRKFSTYKDDSEISKINKKILREDEYSRDMQTILKLCAQTKKETNGYFDILHNGILDPSGLVKGWSIHKAANLLKENGFKNFYIDAGGDIEVSGKNKLGNPWSVGIRNPFQKDQIVKVILISNKGVATSGTSIRGQHIYNPYKKDQDLNKIISLTIIGPNVYEADRFATAAFAMQEEGIKFIENLPDFEGYMIDIKGIATYTSNFEKYIAQDKPEK